MNMNPHSEKAHHYLEGAGHPQLSVGVQLAVPGQHLVVVRSQVVGRPHQGLGAEVVELPVQNGQKVGPQVA